jgi:zinc-binding alcohol dehydrogenase family protein
MRAVGYHQAGPLGRPDALVDLELPDPEPGPGDLLVRVAAVSVNPVDTKVRRSRQPAAGSAQVLGWDAVGVVEGLGAEVHGFTEGDRVFYAGSINRPGTNSQLHVVDHRIAGHAPRSLDDAGAAAVPLTAITAWELLFDRLGAPRLAEADGRTLLVVGGAGGVGSMLIQLARQLTGLTVVATASRPETQLWCLDLGAHAVIDHHEPWAPQLESAGHARADLVAALTHTGEHWPSIVAAIAPQGRIALIDDPDPEPDIRPLKAKSVSVHWESMFTRSLFDTPDVAEQGALLAEVAALLDAGTLRSTVADVRGPISAAALLPAHALLESGRARGKIVLSGW